MRSQHQGVWAQIFIEPKLVVEEEVQKVSVIIGLSLAEEKGTYHGVTVGPHHGVTMLTGLDRSSSVASRIASNRRRCLGWWFFRSVAGEVSSNEGGCLRWELGR
jgi:hypothetical protein